MGKKIVMPLMVIVMMCAGAFVARASVYLPAVVNGAVQSSAIGYGESVTVRGGNWVDVTCEDGQAPTVWGDGVAVIVKCK